MKDINEVIQQIVDEGIKLKNKYLKNIETTPDYVAIFTQNSREYDVYSEEALKIGKLYKEADNGIYVILNNPFETKEGSFSIIKIRKPDEKRPQRGDLDFKTDFSELKQYVDNKNFFEVNATDGAKMIELRDEEFDVLVYFPETPLSVEIQEEIQQKSTQASQDATSQDESYKNKYLQLMADFENYRKRMEQEKATFGAISNMSLIQDLLEISDDINLALNDENLDLERSLENLNIIQDKLVGAADKAGIEKVEVKVGDDFNKDLMEAITTVPDPKNKNKVIAVISSAFKYKNQDTILKPAKVVVGK